MIVVKFSRSYSHTKMFRASEKRFESKINWCIYLHCKNCTVQQIQLTYKHKINNSLHSATAKLSLKAGAVTAKHIHKRQTLVTLVLRLFKVVGSYYKLINQDEYYWGRETVHYTLYRHLASLTITFLFWDSWWYWYWFKLLYFAYHPYLWAEDWKGRWPN